MANRLLAMVLVSVLAFQAMAELPPVPMNSQARSGKETDDRVAWWREARFGLFIHFGVYAIPGRGEWVMFNEKIDVDDYSKLADQFNPQKFDASAWATAAKDAGMKYMVLTAKHHDGFALFDSKASDFNSVKTAARRDFIKEYTQAARDAGLRVGLYYSPLDWRYPGYFFPDLYRKSAEAMREKYHTQVTELMSNYGTIDILWYDGGGENWLGFGGIEFTGGGWKRRDRSRPYTGKFTWEDNKINAVVRKLQPGILINDRTSTTGDFSTREGANKLGGFENQVPWELCLTLAGAWGYQPNAKPRSLTECIHLLANTAGRDGNLLLNVGPRPDGAIEADQVQRLKEIGQWLQRHGESIYGTRGGPLLPTENYTTTHKGNVVYVHVIKWPGETLTLPPIAGKVTSSTLLSGGTVMVKQSEKGIEIAVPQGDRQEADTVVKLTLEEPARP